MSATTALSKKEHRFQPLPGSPLFFNLKPQQSAELSRLHALRRAGERDTQLIRAGDPAAPLLTILSGWAFRYSLLGNGRRQILGLYLPGDTIGLDTLLTGAPVYPVQSASAVTYCMVEHDDAAALAQQTEWFRRQALDALARDRALAELALTRLGQCNAEERVVSVFLELHDRLSGRGLAGADAFTLELTQQHLADLVGLTAVHLNRVLQKLRARRLIEIANHRVTFLDRQALQCMVLLPRMPASPFAA